MAISSFFLRDCHAPYGRSQRHRIKQLWDHGELDDGRVPQSLGAYLPGGVVDGKVVDSNMAKNWQFWAKWGSSCDIGFDAKKFLEKHPQYEWLEAYLKDLPAEPWTIFPLKEKK